VTGQELLTLRGHTDTVNTLAARSDGRQLASGGVDGTVRLWEADGPEPAARLARLRPAAPAALAWHRLQATSCLRGRQWFGARFHVERLTRAEPADPLAHFFRGRVHAAEGQWEPAVAEYSRAIDLAPQAAALRLARHLARVEAGAGGAAAADYTRAASLSGAVQAPTDAWWSQRRVQRGEPEEFLWEGLAADLDEAVKEHSRNPVRRRARGLVHAARGAWDSAREDLAAACEAQPDGAEAWLALARAHAESSRWDEAVDACSKVVALRPAEWPAWYLRGLVRAQSGRHKEAVADLSRAVTLGADGWAVWAQIGESRLALQDWQAAVTDYTRVAKRHPSDFWIWNGRGLAYRGLRQWGQAEADFSRAVGLEPNRPEGWSNRGQVRAERGQWDGAIADLTEVARLRPDSGWSWHHLGLAQLASGDVVAYRRTCADVLKRFTIASPTEDKDATAYLGVLLPETVGDAVALVRLSAQAVAEKPNVGYLRETLGAALYRAGRLQEAAVQLRQAVELSGDGGSAWMQLFLAMTHHRLGHTVTGTAGAIGLPAAPGWPAPLLAASALAVERNQARFWLDAAVRQIEAEKTAGWEDRLRMRLLRDEAQALLQAPKP
jgi:tetratricopeptide (TPR) repeat protein